MLFETSDNVRTFQIEIMKSLIIFICVIAVVLAAPGNGTLDPDNKAHRSISDKLDKKFEDSKAWNNFARPVVHGAYHAGRYVGSGNPAELARSKDQFSKFGTGQQRTDYLQAHRNQSKN